LINTLFKAKTGHYLVSGGPVILTRRARIDRGARID
jgi:hypothetical protein